VKSKGPETLLIDTCFVGDGPDRVRCDDLFGSYGDQLISLGTDHIESRGT